MSGRCSRCPESIEWVRLDTGRAMPINPKPDPSGNVAVMRDGRGVLVGRVVTRERPAMPYEQLHMPHFATCAPTVAHRQAVRDGSVIELARVRRTKGPRP